MGMVYVDVLLGHPSGGDMITVPNVLVDTGATHSVLPASLLAGLHVEPQAIDRIELANGETTEWGIGVAQLGLVGLVGRGQRWPCLVYFGPEDNFLLGATTLENLGLMVDPAGECLVQKITRARPF